MKEKQNTSMHLGLLMPSSLSPLMLESTNPTVVPKQRCIRRAMSYISLTEAMGSRCSRAGHTLKPRWVQKLRRAIRTTSPGEHSELFLKLTDAFLLPAPPEPPVLQHRKPRAPGMVGPIPTPPWGGLELELSLPRSKKLKLCDDNIAFIVNK